MSRRLACCLGSLLTLATLAAPPGTPAVRDPSNRSWPDILTLSNGTSVACRILTASPDAVKIEYSAGKSAAGKTSTREVPWSALRSAEFSMDDEFHRLLDATDPIKDTPRLAARWNTLVPMIGRPNHPAGDLALALARLSLNHPENSARHRALDACQAVATNDWNPSRRHHARWLQVRILAAIGRPDEAATQARQLANEPNATPEAAMPAWAFSARTDFAALRKLEQDHPKWSEDDVVRPERDALFHQTLDNALKPSLFHGALEQPASDGLWTAIEVLEFAQQLPAAADTARDLLKLYPASPRARDAANFLQRHRLPLDPNIPPDEPPAPPTAPAASTPPPTTPEPAVHRRPRYPTP